MRINARTSARTVGRPVRPSALPGPEQAEPIPVPRDDGGRLHEEERRSPLGRDAREPGPQEPVSYGQTQARSARAFQNLELVSEGTNLEVQGRTRANQRTERQEYRYDDGHHPEGYSTVSKNSMNPRVPAFW